MLSGRARVTDYIVWYLDSAMMVLHGVWSHAVEVFWPPDSMVLQHFGNSCWKHRPLVSKYRCLNVSGKVKCSESAINVRGC